MRSAYGHKTVFATLAKLGALAAPATAAMLSLLSTHCSRGEPPSFDGGASSSPSIAPLPQTASAASGVSLFAAPNDAGVPEDASSDASAGASKAAPRDAGDPGTLPQTEDKPLASGAAFDARVAALWEAIVNDSPERALPFFFPVGAYEQVKDIPKPAGDWKARLIRAYKRDIHALHEHLGNDAASAKFLGVDVPDRARWVKPGEEVNKLGYYRVYGTKLRYEARGRERSFDIKSLISWRGEWYVVHLSGFK